METYNDRLAREVRKLVADLKRIDDDDKTKLEKKLERILEQNPE